MQSTRIYLLQSYLRCYSVIETVDWQFGIRNWELVTAHQCQHNTKTPCISRLYRSFDPPKSPLRRGTLNALPPLLMGVRGDVRILLSPLIKGGSETQL